MSPIILCPREGNQAKDPPTLKTFRKSYRAFPAGPTSLDPTPCEPLPPGLTRTQIRSRPGKPNQRKGQNESSWISPIFVNSGVFPWENKHDSHWTFVPECPCEKFMNWPFFGLVCRGDSWPNLTWFWPDSDLKTVFSGPNPVKIRSKSGPNQVRGEGFRAGRVQRGRSGWEGSEAPRESLEAYANKDSFLHKQFGQTHSAVSVILKRRWGTTGTLCCAKALPEVQGDKIWLFWGGNVWWFFCWQNSWQFSPGKIGFKFVTETSPHSSRRSSQEAKKFVTSCSLWGQTHVTLCTNCYDIVCATVLWFGWVGVPFMICGGCELSGAAQKRQITT